MCTCLAPLHFQFLLLKWSKACLVWIYSICPFQTTPKRIKCYCLEIPMLSHIHIMCYSICNWTQHHVAWYLIPTWYGNILPDGMGMSYLCGMGMPYQMEWECHTYVVWECHTRWNGNVIPIGYGNAIPDGMGMSYLCGMGMPYLCGMGMPYQMEWKVHTRWNGNPIPYWSGRNGIIPYHD